LIETLCHICYKPTFGETVIKDKVYMHKTCIEHGFFESIIEPDVALYRSFGFGRNCDVYNAIMLNITDVCNTTCKLCYYPVGPKHKPLEQIKQEAARFPSSKIWLSGGEPTCHPDFMEIIQLPNFGAVLTNGIKFGDIDFLNQFIDAVGTDAYGYVPIEISLHAEVDDRRMVAVNNLRSLGLTTFCAMFSINSLDDVAPCVEIWESNKDVFANMRIRLPFNSWGQESVKHIYMSDLLNTVLNLLPGLTLTENIGGNSIYNINLAYGDRYISLCCAPHKEAADLTNTSCAPRMLANDNHVYPIPYGLIINEGISKGII